MPILCIIKINESCSYPWFNDDNCFFYWRNWFRKSADTLSIMELYLHEYSSSYADIDSALSHGKVQSFLKDSLFDNIISIWLSALIITRS